LKAATPITMSTVARQVSVLALTAAVGLLGLTFGCSDSPTVPPPPPPPQPPPNNAPVISSIRIQGARLNEPSNFADLLESVNVTADVRDDETPVAQLQFIWSSTIGTFSGGGSSVTWQAPAAATTPADVTLRLEVVERYGPPAAPTAFEHRVSSSATLRLHDSLKEVGDMSRQFLLDFSDSSIRDVAYIMRNFEQGCYGTAAEAAEVAENRVRFQIVSSSVGAAAVTVNFGGVCPFRARPGDACAQVPVVWDSIDRSTGVRGTVRGTDQVAAVYVRSRGEWRLCDSQFNGVVPLQMRGFIR
jgi:hypothetical protein